MTPGVLAERGRVRKTLLTAADLMSAMVDESA
jgi:hypothetical protein